MALQLVLTSSNALDNIFTRVCPVNTCLVGLERDFHNSEARSQENLGELVARLLAVGVKKRKPTTLGQALLPAWSSHTLYSCVHSEYV